MNRLLNLRGLHFLPRIGLAFVLLCAAAFTAPASSHSLDSLQQDMFTREKYFQIKDEPAPDFALQDDAGNALRLVDLRKKVVVLNFIYTNCPDVCPLQSEKIADIQKLMNVAPPMRDRVAFITITTDPSRDTPDVL